MAPPFVIRDTNSTSHASVPTKAPMLIAVDATLLTATFLVLIGRFYSRYSILKRVGKDDWCILGAAIGMFSSASVRLLMIKYGLGRHVWDVTPDQMPKQYTLGIICRILYLPTVAMVRISILLFMRHLSPHTTMQYATAILIFVNFAAALICALLLLFNCTPARSLFIFPPLRPPGRKCVGDDLAIEKAVPIVNALLDFVVWLVPVAMMVNVKFLGWKQKLLQVMLLGLGLVACIPSVLRLPNIDSMKKDISWHGVVVSLWMDVEISVGIIAASVPALYPLFVMFMRQSFESWAPKFTFRSHSTNTQIHDQPGRSDTLSKNSVPLEDMRGDNDDKKVVVCTVRRHSSVEPLYPPSLGPSMVDDKRSSGEN